MWSWWLKRWNRIMDLLMPVNLKRRICLWNFGKKTPKCVCFVDWNAQTTADAKEQRKIIHTLCLERHICFTNDSDDLTTLTKRFIEIWIMTDLHDSTKQNQRNRLNSINNSTHIYMHARMHTLWTYTIEQPKRRLSVFRHECGLH